jgi:uncharacterized protein (DUF2384 family)
MATPAGTLDNRATVQISGFVESLQEPKTPYISLERFSDALGVKRASMATITGVHRNTLRNPASERLQNRLREMIRVITAAATLTGDMQKAIYWFRNEPIVDYDHKTAAELVAEGHADAALAYLRDLGNGANG